MIRHGKKAQTENFGPDIFRWGRGLSEISRRGHWKRGICIKLSEIDFQIRDKFATMLRTLPLMHETKYWQFCANLAQFATNLRNAPSRTPPSRDFRVFHVKEWGPKSAVCPSKPGTYQTFLAGYPGILLLGCAGGARKVREKTKFVFNFCRVHAKGVVLCERAFFFCLLSTF